MLDPARAMANQGGMTDSSANTGPVNADLSFEEALGRLEDIVRMLESGDAPLDRSIELYQEGEKLRQQCEARLKDAQARIEKIVRGADGEAAGLAPLDPA